MGPSLVNKLPFKHTVPPCSRYFVSDRVLSIVQGGAHVSVDKTRGLALGLSRAWHGAGFRRPMPVSSLL